MSTIETRQKIKEPASIRNALITYMEIYTRPGDTLLPEQTANLLWHKGLISSYHDIESALRSRGNEQIYFFGSPLSYIKSKFPDAESFQIKYPVPTIRNIFISPKFSLIIESGGMRAAEIQRKELGISVFENLENLKRTGILYPKNVVEENIVFTR